ncbi:uncharacterized protein LOC134700316 [Mytilus trossulus]|uniref:uncharacterized protein LOC134700316 n=1 Tax=Mytilus trossulus TaxID=6551 RepID=UPI0030057588
MSFSTSNQSLSQQLYTSSGMNASVMTTQQHISFIPVPLTHNVEVIPSSGFPPSSTNFSNSPNSANQERPKPQIMILEKLKQLRDVGRYCDLFIDVKGMRFIAHKSLVAAWSPYFDEALTSTDYVDKDLLIVHYDSYEVFADFLEFLYTGTIAPRETNFLQLLHLAVSFKIDLLKSYCEEFLRCNLHLGNFVSTYFLSRKYSLDELEEFLVGFLQSNLSDAVKQSEFLQMKAGKIHALLSKGCMLKLKPEMKLFLVISWVGFEVQPREKFLVLLLKHIDWSSVASDFLLEISRTENFFTTHESSLYLLLQTLFSSGISLGPYTETFSSLRHTYSHLLTEVVTSGLILPEVDDFIAVTAVGTTTRHIKLNTGTNTDNMPYMYIQSHTAKPVSESDKSFQPEENEENFNESAANENEVTGSQSMEPVEQETSSTILTPELEKTPSKSIRGKVKKKIKIMSKDTLIVSRSYTQPEYQPRSSPQPSGESQDQSENNTEDSTQNIVEEDLEKDEENNEEFNEFEEEENAEEDEDYIHEMEEEGEEEDGSDTEKNEVKKGSKKKKNTPIYNMVKLECPHCSYSTKIEGRLRKHLKWNHENDILLKCTVCNAFETKSNRTYSDHMKKHFDGPPFHCEVYGCDYSTEKFPTLLIHRMKHFEERPYACGICNARFRTRNNLYAHKKTHTGKRPFQCPHCPKSFAVKNTLDQHLVIHDDLRPYLCDFCGFATKYQSHLTAHKRTHTGEVFKCEHPKCNYTTPKRSQLKCHMRTHLGIRSYVCVECGKSFIEKSHLKRHEKIHLSDKPFKCNLCDYSTNRKDKLKYHLNKSHDPNGEKKTKGRPSKPRIRKPVKQIPPPIILTEGGKIQIPPHNLIMTQSKLGIDQAVYVKNFDHSGYTIQGITDNPGAHALTLEEIRQAQFGHGSLEGVTIQVPITMEHLVMAHDEINKTSTSRPLPATSPVTPVTLIPEDHQTYIQNVMTQVPMTSAGQQTTTQSQDYSQLGPFIQALF